MASMLGEFEQLILFALLALGENAYGVSIRREIESRTGKIISSGAVYTALDRLETRGFVRSSVGAPTPTRGGRRKKFYRIEPAGAQALGELYRRLLMMARGVTPKLAAMTGLKLPTES